MRFHLIWTCEDLEKIWEQATRLFQKAFPHHCRRRVSQRRVTAGASFVNFRDRFSTLPSCCKYGKIRTTVQELQNTLLFLSLAIKYSSCLVFLSLILGILRPNVVLGSRHSIIELPTTVCTTLGIDISPLPLIPLPSSLRFRV